MSNIPDSTLTTASATETLRQQAIQAERDGESWETVRAIYQEGLAMGGYDFQFVRSLAVSALGYLPETNSSAQTDAGWAIERLIELESSAPASADTLYLKACLIYWSLFARDASRSESARHAQLHEAVSAYRQCLEADAGHWLARYYLVCCLIDLGDWNAALPEIRFLLTGGAFPPNQAWRRSKLQEWQIVGLFHRQEPEAAETLLEAFLNQFRPEDIMSLEDTLESLDELEQCLSHQKIRPALRERFEHLKEALKKAGMI